MNRYSNPPPFMICNDPLLDGMFERNGFHLLIKLLRRSRQAASEMEINAPRLTWLTLTIHQMPDRDAAYTGNLAGTLQTDGSCLQRIELAGTGAEPVLEIEVAWAHASSPAAANQHSHWLESDLGCVEIVTVQQSRGDCVPVSSMIRWMLGEHSHALTDTYQLRTAWIEFHCDCEDGDVLRVMHASSSDPHRADRLHRLELAETHQVVASMNTSWRLAEADPVIPDRHPEEQVVSG